MEIEYITAKTLVTSAPKSGSWFGVDYNMNIYRGCAYGCIYCDSRSSCYRNVNFDQIKAKENALQIMRDELRRKVKSGVIATGSMSDPYNHLEKKLKLTRNALELMNAYQFGVAIATKGSFITRDIDILQDIKRHSPVLIKMTITAVDDALSQKIEPYAPPSSARFAAIRKLSDSGIFCGVLMMPVLPYITDSEENIRGIVREAAAAGAKFIYPAFGMTLRDGNREYFYRKLDENFPGMKEHYVKRFGDRYSCGSPRARKLWELFGRECAEHGIIQTMSGITQAYRSAYQEQQFSFFDRV